MTPSPTPSQHPIDGAIQRYLCYQDAQIPDAQKAAALQYSLTWQSARDYATALLGLFEAHGEGPVIGLATRLRDKYLTLMDTLGIEGSPYGRSLTWAVWDIAKQYHFYLNKQEATAHYPARNPMRSDDVTKEIVDRHLGWEVHAAVLTGGITTEQLKDNVPPRNWQACLALLAATPKSTNNTLASWQLSQLGALLRPAPSPHGDLG